jgi:hypothetical protein
VSEPIKDAAANCLDILGENTEDLMDETAAATWPKGEEDWYENAPGTKKAEAHSERTFAKVLRALIPLLESAAVAADKRASGGSADQ